MAALLAPQFIGPLIGAAVAFTVGFTSAEIYEHKVPWGLKAQNTALIAGEPAKLAAAVAQGEATQKAADAPAFATWASTLAQCRSDQQSSRDAQARQIAATDKFTNAQAAQAYAMGRATCGPNANANPSSSAASARSSSVPNGSDDFSTTFGAAASAPR